MSNASGVDALCKIKKDLVMDAQDAGLRDLENAAARLNPDRGPEPYRNRYRIDGPKSFILRAQFIYAHRFRRVLIRAGRWIAEQLLFGRPHGIVRPALRRSVSSFVRHDLKDLSPTFDAGLYVAQFRSDVRRKRAAVDPLLHYRLIGWREVRTPNAAFDPVFYLHQNPEIGRKSDPYLHYLRHGRTRGAGAAAEIAQLQAASGAFAAGPRYETTPVLIFNHGRGGGAVRYLQLANMLRGPCIGLRPIAGKPSLVVWESADEQTAFDLSKPQDWRSLEQQARRVGIARLLVNHVIDQEPDVLPRIYGLAANLGVPYDVVLHDYYFLCPRVDGITGEGRFCGIAPVSTCAGCITRDHSELGRIDPEAWRRLTLRFLQGAKSVLIHSKDFADRVGKHLPGVRVVVEPLEGDIGYPAETHPELGPGQALRVATLGALNIPKGGAIVLDLAVELKRHPKLHLTIIGPTIFDKLFEREGIAVTGRYREQELHDLIQSHAPDVIFLPAIWPETWSFVLTEALKTGLPIVAFDIGAPAERLRSLKRGHLIPLDFAYRSGDLANVFEDLRHAWTRSA